MLVKGFCEKKFLEIKEIFNNSFEDLAETGAAFSIVQNKKKIISLYGGVTNSQNSHGMKRQLLTPFLRAREFMRLVLQN